VSAVAVQWVKRQVIDDRTLTSLLSLLAKKADASGRCEIKQSKIAEMIGVSQRTVERSMPILESLQFILRHRNVAYQKRGRSADTIYLCLDRELEVTKVKIKEVKSLGPTRQNVGKKARDQPAKMSGAPKCEKTKSQYIARARGLNAQTSPLKASRICSTRVRFDRDRSQWRADIKVDGLTLYLGRFEIEAEAIDAAAAAKADVIHTVNTKSGTPVRPCITPALASLDGYDLFVFLFVDDHPPTSDPRSRHSTDASDSFCPQSQSRAS